MKPQDQTKFVNEGQIEDFYRQVYWQSEVYQDPEDPSNHSRRRDTLTRQWE